MARSSARAAAMQLIYARMLGGEGDLRTLTDLVAPTLELDADDQTYIEDVIEGVWRFQTDIDQKIAALSRGWPLARMARVDLAILRLSAYEMAHREDVPVAASINEAIELTRTYSTEDSGAFVNGILGSMNRERTKEASK